MSSESARAVYKQVLDAFNDHDWSRVTSCFADNAVLDFPGDPPLGGRWYGINRIIDYYGHIKEYVESTMPDLRAEIETALTGPDDEYAIVFRQRWTADGAAKESLGVAIIKTEEGKLTYLKDFLPY